MYYLFLCANNKDAWYNQNVVNTILGFVLSTLVFLISTYLGNKKAQKEEKVRVLLHVADKYSYLFSLIYNGAYYEDKIKYKKIREELDKNNFIYLLPSELRNLFLELYDIYFTGPKHYEQNKILIHGILCDIVKKLNEYGVDVFGYK